MTKKKYNRPKHQKDVPYGDTSEEEFSSVSIQGKSCPHVARGIHFGRVKKSLKPPQSITCCNGCSSEDSVAEDLPEVWLCLQCGYRGCGRASQNKHALQHYKTLHSDCHSLVLSISSGSVWCYDCDDEISLQSSRVLKQCVEFVMRMVPNASNKPISSENKFTSQQNLHTSVIKEEPSMLNSKENGPVEKKDFVKSNKESSQKIPIKGLRNLGNTCFFNAVMQNLNQTPLLYFELKQSCTPSHLWKVPELVFLNNEVAESDSTNLLKLSLPRQLPLTNSLLNFLEQMQAPSSAKTEVINPSPLFGEISKKCPQFRHFQQQDSHELLRQLLDNVRQEEIKRQKKAILRHFDLENASPESVDDETKKQIKAYGWYASHTIVEKVFGGLLISTVLCEECKASSQVFEPFMDLSLPLFEEKPLRNKKADLDSDENTPGEYILSKPKNDPGKPSKHQEKKQKQLARKEKKKAKHARNRKISASENNDDTTNIQLNENKEDLSEKEDDQEDEKLNHGDDEDEEVWEVKELFGSDEKISNIDIRDDESALQQYVINECDIDNSYNQNVEIEDSSDMPKNDINCEASILHTPESTSVAQEYPLQVQNDLECKETSEIKNTEESMTLETTVAPGTQMSEKDVHPETVNEVADITALENNEDLDTSQVIHSASKETVEEDEKENEPENKENQRQEAEQNDYQLNQDDEDDDFRTLTEKFSTCLKITDPLDIDDRIQTLSLQVKDVRIRRDSDRQENLLNSSESADECESLKTSYTSPKSSIEDSCSLDNCDNWSHSLSEQQTKDWISKTLTTLKPRHHVSPLECSINSCLIHFTKPELLTGNNKFRCENCTELKIKRTGNKKDVVYSNASKQMLIFSPPAVLTLHLKRFQQVGMSLRKVNRFVEFPLLLDLAPFCCSASSVLPHMSSTENEIVYSLYGVVEHSGRLTSGHYTAYVKANKRSIIRTFECQLPLAHCNLEQLLHKFSGIQKNSTQSTDEKIIEDSKWFYISDSHVKEVSETQVLKCQAYLLFYERIK